MLLFFTVEHTPIVIVKVIDDWGTSEYNIHYSQKVRDIGNLFANVIFV